MNHSHVAGVFFLDGPDVGWSVGRAYTPSEATESDKRYLLNIIWDETCRETGITSPVCVHFVCFAQRTRMIGYFTCDRISCRGWSNISHVIVFLVADDRMFHTWSYFLSRIIGYFTCESISCRWWSDISHVIVFLVCKFRSAVVTFTTGDRCEVELFKVSVHWHNRTKLCLLHQRAVGRQFGFFSLSLYHATLSVCVGRDESILAVRSEKAEVSVLLT